MSLLNPRRPRLALQGLSFLSTVIEQSDVRQHLASSGVVEAAVALFTVKDERVRMRALAFIAHIADQGTLSYYIFCAPGYLFNFA